MFDGVGIDDIGSSGRQQDGVLKKISGNELRKIFDAAVRVIRSLPTNGPYQPSSATNIRFYSLYKQAVDGKWTPSQPIVFNQTKMSRAKRDAWIQLGDMDSEEAMREYINELKKIVETMSFNGDVQEFLETINPFYEFVSLQGAEVDRRCSSSSSSSLIGSRQSSTQSTPINFTPNLSNHRNEDFNCGRPNGYADTKESLEAIPLTRTKVNGHLPNQLESRRLINTDSSYPFEFHPPAAPVHRRSIHGFPSGTLSEFPTIHDDILKVDVDEEDGPTTGTLHARLSAENLVQSSTESEKYYSGDSDPEIESPSPSTSITVIRRHELGSFVPFPNETAISRRSSSPSGCSPKAVPSVDFILHNTVERLNRDVEHILARVRLLETAYSTNDHTETLSASKVTTRFSRGCRSIFGLTPPALALILTWPFLAYFIINLVRKWLEGRRRHR